MQIPGSDFALNAKLQNAFRLLPRPKDLKELDQRTMLRPCFRLCQKRTWKSRGPYQLIRLRCGAQGAGTSRKRRTPSPVFFGGRCNIYRATLALTLNAFLVFVSAFSNCLSNSILETGERNLLVRFVCLGRCKHICWFCSDP